MLTLRGTDLGFCLSAFPDQGVGITDGVIAVWDVETHTLFATVMFF